MSGALTPRRAVTSMKTYSAPTSGREEMLRLDFNENTAGCSPRVAEFLRNRLTRESLSTYPDYEAARAQLADYFGVCPRQTILTNGTDEAIQLVVNAFVDPGERVVVLRPTYAMYRFYSEVMGAEVIEVGYEGESFSFPPKSIIEAAIGARAVFIANPNNPTGTQVSLESLREVLTALPRTAVLVDEAYFEFSGVTVLPWLKEFPNLLVSRTMSKAYGLAGLRCGILFSQEGNVTTIKRLQSPYSVNTVAASAAAEAVLDHEYLDRYVNEVRSQRTRLYGEFARLGVPFVESAGNFVLFWPKDKAKLLTECRQAGVLLRDRDHDSPGAARVTVGTETQMDRFVQLLEASCRG